MAEKFIAHLKVDKEIVSLLSKSTYQKSFSSAIRELVSNAYDADALSVKIKFDGKFSSIEVRDDGNGMTRSEFEKYLTIAGTKMGNQLSRKYKRQRIGQFGVGFLSIFPFCDNLEIITTSENSSEILKAKIPAKDYFKDSKVDKSTQVGEVEISGVIDTNPSEKFEHYTIIRLLSPTHLVRQYFKKLDTKKRDSIIAWPPVKKFIWELEDDLPISLPENSKYYKSFKYEEPIGIKVIVNGQELYRHDYLKNLLTEGSIDFGEIKCKYIFTTENKSIKPEEARGVKLRVNNVGIGARTDFLLKRSRGFPRLHFITGEIFISDSIKASLNLGRDGFISNPLTDEIFQYFAGILRSVEGEVQFIAEAEKNINNILSVNRSDASKSKNEILSENIKKLQTKGYKLVEIQEKNRNKFSNDVTVNKDQKTIYVAKDALIREEKTRILKTDVQITYEKWNISDPNPAIKKSGANKIIINQNYPLFKSKSLGNVFKRFLIFILVASEKSKSTKQLLEIINSNFKDEFKDFI